MAVILIVDDEVFIREATALMIEDLGHGTLSASDVDGALSILRAPQHIDALITDIRLKAAALGGCDLAHQAMKLRPQLRVLYASGSSATARTEALFVEGAHFVQKPYSQAQLGSAIADLLAAPDASTRSTPSP